MDQGIVEVKNNNRLHAGRHFAASLPALGCSSRAPLSSRESVTNAPASRPSLHSRLVEGTFLLIFLEYRREPRSGGAAKVLTRAEPEGDDEAFASHAHEARLPPTAGRRKGLQGSRVAPNQWLDQ